MSKFNSLANATYNALTKERNYLMLQVDDQASSDKVKAFYDNIMNKLMDFEDMMADEIGEDMDESAEQPSAMRKLMSITEQDDDAVSEIYQALHDLGAEWNTKPSNWRQIGHGNNVVYYEDIESVLDKHGIVSADWSKYLAAPNPSATKTSSREVALVLVGDDMYLGFGRDAFYNQWVKVVS
ncbi:MAG: hypothetical protein CMN60_20980 [Sphingobium sp.]|nr:hypothetical protein [Sphingobium sp.]MBS50108.1 hypothetical protein [Sphingobium sp.]|tara:strand:- start:1216 stop:1761 length:546 start_codon:yes stop_codon:yes gene_type:complete